MNFPKNIILTGHKGLIGRELTKRFISNGYNIRYKIDARSGFNILDLKSLKLNQRTEPVELFVHTAAYCKIAECIDNPEISFENNVRGTFEVFEFCRKNKIPKIMYFSSSRVLSPERNIYTASKLFGEEMCKGYKDSYGLEYLIIRPSTVYGGGFHDITSRLMTEWIIAGLKNKELPIFGKEGKTLDFTYVTDFVDGVMLTIPQIDKEYNIYKEYNISGGKERKLIDLADLIIKETGGGYIRWHDAERAQPQKVNIDISEIQRLGYKPKVSLEEGVRRTVNWYKDNPEVWNNG